MPSPPEIEIRFARKKLKEMKAKTTTAETPEFEELRIGGVEFLDLLLRLDALGPVADSGGGGGLFPAGGKEHRSG